MERNAQDGGAGRQLRVGLVGADPLRTLGLQALLEGNPQISVVSGDMGSTLRNKALDIVLLGASPVDRLFDLIATLRGFRPDLRIIVLGKDVDPEHVEQVISVGAMGYLSETANQREILMAIQEVFDGSVWAPRRVLSRLINHASHPAASDASSGAQFTARELDVLNLLVAGSSNREIGKVLGIGERTVKSHIGRLMRKTGVQNRIALSMHAINKSLVRVNGLP